jgi:hypothetical protein
VELTEIENQQQQQKRPGSLAYTRNPNYLESRDWEDGGSRPALGKSARPYLKNT